MGISTQTLINNPEHWMPFLLPLGALLIAIIAGVKHREIIRDWCSGSIWDAGSAFLEGYWKMGIFTVFCTGLSLMFCMIILPSLSPKYGKWLLIAITLGFYVSAFFVKPQWVQSILDIDVNPSYQHLSQLGSKLGLITVFAVSYVIAAGFLFEHLAQGITEPALESVHNNWPTFAVLSGLEVLIPNQLRTGLLLPENFAPSINVSSVNGLLTQYKIGLQIITAYFFFKLLTHRKTTH